MTGYENWSASERAPAEEEADLLRALTDGGAARRRDAALGLATTDDLADRTVAELERRARRDPDPDVRQFAVEALGTAGRGRDAVGAALADDAEWVRAEAVVALSRIAGADAADRLAGVVTDDEAGPVRRNALVALAKAGAAGAETVRGRLKHDPHPPVREYAAGFLPDTGLDTADVERLLAAVLARDPDAFVRARAATALGRVGTDRAVEALESQGLADASDDVQRAARRALAAARGEDPDRVAADVGAPGGGPGSRQAGGPGPAPGPGSAPGSGPRSGPGAPSAPGSRPGTGPDGGRTDPGPGERPPARRDDEPR